MYGRVKKSPFRLRAKSSSSASAGKTPTDEHIQDNTSNGGDQSSDGGTTPARSKKSSHFSPLRFFKRASTSTSEHSGARTTSRARSQTVECLTTSQRVNVEDFLNQFSSSNYASAVEALKASDWDMSVACILQEKLERANAMLEVEQKALLEQALDQYVTKFNEAVDIQEKMDEMAAVLAAEEAELVAQQRMVEIDRFEQEHYPEKDEKNAQLTAGDDEFTKEMKEKGLRHVTGLWALQKLNLPFWCCLWYASQNLISHRRTLGSMLK